MGRAQNKRGAASAANRRATDAAAQTERAFKKGHRALLQQNLKDAANAFEHALAHDPECADALLGLHAAGRVLERHLERLAACAERIGELQERLRRPLRSYTAPAGFQRHPLQTRDDALRAHAGELLDGGNVSEAAVVLARSDPKHPATMLVKARVALNAGKFEECVELAQAVRSREAVGADAHLLLGLAYTELSLYRAAVDSFGRAEELADNPAGALAARYHRALTLQRAGAFDAARSELEALYHHDAGYADVGERLRAMASHPSAEPNGAAAGSPPPDSESAAGYDQWDDLTRQLEHGELATDPDIGDNRPLL